MVGRADMVSGVGAGEHYREGAGEGEGEVRQGGSEGKVRASGGGGQQGQGSTKVKGGFGANEWGTGVSHLLSAWTGLRRLELVGRADMVSGVGAGGQ